MIHCKKRCEHCGTYTPCNGLQIGLMHYCKECRTKLKIRTTHTKPKKIQTMITKKDQKIMEKWRT